MTRKNKDYPQNDVSSLKQTISNLKAQVKRRDKQIERLKGELVSLEKAFNESKIFINSKLEGLSIETIVNSVGKQSKKQKQKDLRKRWKCDKCQSGFLKIDIINVGSYKKYRRKCVNSKCGHTTRLQTWHEGVEEGPR